MTELKILSLNEWMNESMNQSSKQASEKITDQSIKSTDWKCELL